MKRPIGEKIMMAAGLQTECVPGTPLIEIYGKYRVLVENHKGVLIYTNQEIVISTKIGPIRILGTDLCIACISEHNLVITGYIQQVIEEED